MGLSKFPPEGFDLGVILGFLGRHPFHPEFSDFGANPKALAQGKEKHQAEGGDPDAILGGIVLEGMKKVIGHHENRPAEITDQVIGGKELALHLAKDLAGKGLKEDGGLDEGEIKKGSVPKNKSELVDKAKNRHRVSLFSLKRDSLKPLERSSAIIEGMEKSKKVKITFPRSGQECEVDYDDTLPDATFRYDLPIRYRCERAVCTTCLIEVLEGADKLSPPGEREAQTLKTIGAAPHWRLACQCSVEGDIKLDYIPITDPRRKKSNEETGPF
jgi:ferredoxin